MADLPVIVLAFANEYGAERYLARLAREQLWGSLKEAGTLCEPELVINATLDKIDTVFERHRQRVAIFHYGGHADEDCLLLASSARARETDLRGLLGFWGRKGGLRLVFLNGCSTQPQVDDLLKAGVSAVVATARPIDDDAACQFAGNFYRKLTAGYSVRDAFDQAQELVNPGGRFTPRDMIRQRVDIAPEDITGDRGFPWVLRSRDGSHVEHISLPELAGDPLFGLPDVPRGEHLPPSPYRHLKPFTRKEAAVFFGRGQAIRALYDLATSPSTRPVILYSGPTGVGKSSVLDAGLRPRLESSHRVVFLRRQADLGLLGTLLRGLAAESGATAADLNRLWVDSEETIDKPLIVVLDQAEEAFTRPHQTSPAEEVTELVRAVRDVFLGPLRSPRGKLTLGFRKEWLQEFERAHDEVELSYERMLLAALDRGGIIEAIEGPVRDPDLRRHYGLTIDPGLAGRIAGEIEHDAGSALAPTLQVLLTKLWESARGKGASFTGALYDRLKDRGFLLKDVLDEGLKALAAWRPELVDSGFALDLLEHHTTSMDTAATRTRPDLLARYPHRADVLGECLRILQKSYLLIPAETRLEGDVPASPRYQPRPDAAATRLGHDTLAPLVREMFRTSFAPGQRARRLLENRAPEWQDGGTGHVLDNTDLRAVEDGRSGMRVWTRDEARLIEASRRAEEEQLAREQERARRLHEAEKHAEERRRQAEEETKRRLKEQQESNLRLRKRAVALGATLAVTVGVALLAADRWRAAVRATGIANEKTEDAKKAAANLEQANVAITKAKGEAEAALAAEKTAKANVLTALKASRREAYFADIALIWKELEHPRTLFRSDRYWPQGDMDRTRSLLMKYGRSAGDGEDIRGFEWGYLVDRYIETAANAANPARLPEVPSRILRGHDGEVHDVDVSQDGRLLVTGGHDGTVRLWDTTSGRVMRTFQGHRGAVTGVSLSADTRRIASGGYDGTVRVWDASSGEEVVVLRGHETAVSGVALSGNGLRVVSISHDRTVRCWDTVAPRSSLVLHGHEAPAYRVVLSSDGQRIASAGGGDETVRIWDAGTGRSRSVLRPATGRRGYVWSVAFSPNGQFVASGNGGGTIRIWDTETGRERSVLEVDQGVVGGVAFSPDGRRIVSGALDGTVRVWDVETGRDILAFQTGTYVRAISFSGDGRLLAAVGADGTVRLWLSTVEAPAELPWVAAPRPIGD
jgi:hypothetical protein